MTTQYGIGVTKNRFELADIFDEDPLEVLKIAEQEKEAKKKTKLCEKENKGTTKKETSLAKPKAPVARKIKETQNLKPQEGQKGKEDKPRVPRVERGGDRERKFPSESQDDLKNRKNRDRPQGEFHREERSDKPERRGEFRSERSSFYGDAGSDTRGRGRGGRGGGFGPRGGRGGRGGSRTSFDSRGKREYDRQSGSDKTGVKPVDKRDGSGAHNWGNHRDDIEDLNNSMVQSGDDGNNTWSPEKHDGDSAPEVNGGVVEGEEATTSPPEEERKELTLDEWKALKAPRQKPTYNLRKAGEGEDPSQWKKMYALQKKKDGEEEEEEEEYEYENCEYPQRVGRQKHILDIDIHFKDTRGGGRGRGNRGPGRSGQRTGAGGGGAVRGNNFFVAEKQVPGRDNGPKIAPKVDDEHDFPSLG